MLDPAIATAAIVMSEGRLYTSTVSITVNFLAPAKPGPIIAEAKLTQLGKRLRLSRASCWRGTARCSRPQRQVSA
jgi:acyl-coenzyme A thioesterase PaaI-like protein